MEEAEDEPLFCERAAGIDIGKQAVMVTVRVPSGTAGEAGHRRPGVRHHARQLLELADWLRSWGVERAGMESTSDYWKPVSSCWSSRASTACSTRRPRLRRSPGGRRPLARPGWRR